VYAKVKGYSAQEAKLSYLDLVKSWEIYGAAYFFVSPGQNAPSFFPIEVVLAINAKAIIVVDPESKRFLDKYHYADIVTWGHSSKAFVVVVGDLVSQNKVHFTTDQGKDINALVNLYVAQLSKGRADTAVSVSS
jgi:hypothetical protein